jgi:hypothetical protein
MTHSPGREERERNDGQQRRRCDDGQVTAQMRAATPCQKRERDESEREELRSRSDAKRGEAQGTAPGQQRGERKQRQSRRPEVEALENEPRRERERQSREDEHPGRDLGRSDADEEQRDDEQDDRRRAESEHEEAEPVVVAVIGRPRSEHDGQESGRVLQDEVAVRHLPVEGAMGIVEVLGDVAAVRAGEQVRRRQKRDGEKDDDAGGRDRSGPSRRHGASGLPQTLVQASTRKGRAYMARATSCDCGLTSPMVRL